MRPKGADHLPGDGVVHTFRARPGLRLLESGAATAAARASCFSRNE